MSCDDPVFVQKQKRSRMHENRINFSGGSGVRIHLPMQETEETQIQSLGLENPLKEEMATHSSMYLYNIMDRTACWAVHGVIEGCKESHTT